MALGILAAIALLFLPDSPISVDGGKNSDKEDAETENGFAISGTHFRDAHEALGGLGSSDGWTGGSSASYTANNAGVKNLLGEIVAASQDVDTTVQTQTGQVNDGRENLCNTFDGLQLAMPVSESLHSSGPARARPFLQLSASSS